MSRPTPRSARLRVRLCAAAGIWLCASGFGPCDEPTPAPSRPPPPSGPPQAESSPTGSAAASPPAASPPSPPAASEAAAPPRPQQRTATTRSYMQTHFADTRRMREAIIAGQLEELRAAAASVAEDEWTPQLRGDYQPHVSAVRKAAQAARTAPSLVEAAAALGTLGEACGNCHRRFGTPQNLSAPAPFAAGADESMVAHARATELLWEGLILPSDTSWLNGARALIDAPALDSDVADVAAAAHQVRDLARRGTTAEPSARPRIYGSLLLTCSGCHERLGVNVRVGEPAAP